jgi:hypothetical protein
MSPKPICTAEYPSFSTVLTCVTMHGPAWITVTGMALPSSVKVRVMPSFEPSSVKDMVDLRP